MKWCQNCNALFYSGQVCPQCASYLYDVPQQQQTYCLQPTQISPKRRSATAIIFGVLSLLLAIALAFTVYSMLTKEPERIETIVQAPSSSELEAKVFKSGYQWFSAVRASVEPFIEAQNNTPESQEFVYDGSPESSELMSQWGQAFGEAISQLMLAGALTMPEYFDIVDGPIQSLKNNYPSVVAAWDDIYRGQIDTTSVPQEGSFDDFLVAGEAYKQAATAAGFDTSGW